MKNQYTSGISLKPSPDKQRSFFASLLDSALLLCGILLPLHALCGILTEGNVYLTLGSAVLALLLTQLSQKIKKLHWLELALPAVCLLLLLLFSGQMRSGWQSIYENACNALTLARGTLYLPRVSEETGVKSAALFCCVISALLALLCSRLANQSRTLCGAGLCIFTIGMTLLLQPQSGEGWMAISLLCALLLLPKQLPGKGDRLQVPETAAMLSLLLLLALSLHMLPTGQSDFFANITGKSEEVLHRLRYEKKENALPEGDLSQDFTPASTSEPLLQVTMEQPEALYLRGFTGEVLENDRWSGFSRETLAEEGNLLYWLHKTAFYPQSQLWSAIHAMDEDTLTQSIFIENLGACSELLYLPCGLAPGEDYLPTQTALEPSTVSSEGLGGTREYTLKALVSPADCARAAVEYYSASPEEAQNYLSGESAWRAFLQQQQSIPEASLTLLQPLLDECCKEYGDASSLTLEQAQRSTMKFLDTYVTSRENEDILLPLDETVKGTEYQTATLTVLALRYYGIAARYAEGFVLSQAMASQAQPGQPILLDASCAHAWAEVYQDGVGWLPLELTPGYTLLLDNISQETKLQTGLSGEGEQSADTLPDAQPPEQTETESPEQTELPTDSPEPLGLPPVKILWLTLLAIFILLLLLLLAIFLRYRANRKKRARQFSCDDPAEAIRWIGLSLEALLPRLSLDRKGGSFYALCRDAEALEPGFGKALSQMADTLGEAMFSSHPMSNAQAQSAREFWMHTVRLLPKRQKRLKRLWIKWILCLY